MRVLVTGAAGFVGRHLVRRLTGAGHQVLSVDRTAPAVPMSGEEVAVVDVADEGALRRAAAGAGSVDGVAWLASPMRHEASARSAAGDVDVIIDAPLVLLSSLARPPATFVLASSIQVYGVPRRLPVDEDHPTDPIDSYGAAKLGAEHLLRIASGAATAFAALRIAFVYGPGQHPANVIPRFLAALSRGEAPTIFGSGDDVRDDVYVDDVALAFTLALERRARGTFNVASGRPHSLKDVAVAACQAAAHQGGPSHAPAWEPWIDRWFAVERARRELGFEATTQLSAGLAAMIAAR